MLRERAIAWARQLPPHTRVWIDDALFTQLWVELAEHAGPSTFYVPAYDPWYLHLRTVMFAKRSARGQHA